METEDEKPSGFGAVLVDILTKLKEFSRAEFQTERLRSYYLAHPKSTAPAYWALGEARRLEASSPSAACVLATTATELVLKEALLRPLVDGLVHHEALAKHVTDLALAHTRFDRFDPLLVQIVQEFAGINMKPVSGRKGKKMATPLWSGMRGDRVARNAVVHAGIPATAKQAAHAIHTASTMLDEVLGRVFTRLGLTTNDGGTIVAEFSVDDMLAIAAGAKQ
jgi:hypothetical protein